MGLLEMGCFLGFFRRGLFAKKPDSQKCKSKSKKPGKQTTGGVKNGQLGNGNGSTDTVSKSNNQRKINVCLGGCSHAGSPFFP